MKIKIDLNFEILDLDGKKQGIANKMIAALLMSEFAKADAEKFFDWALSFNLVGITEVDSADLTKLHDLINSSERITVMAKAPIIKYLNTLKK